MKRVQVLRLINPILALSFLLAIVGMVLYKYGPEALQGSELALELHEIGGLVMIIIGILHLILNWGWVKNSYFKKKIKK